MAGEDTSWSSTSATELARRIRAREVTSEQVVREHISAIEQHNPALNAVVATRFDEAIAEARACDRRLAAEPADADLGAFFGVPCTIKESFELEGMPNTSGLVSRKGVTATRDATAVRRLRAAGAIPLGVTNTSELCMWMESNNRVYGRTNNPYDGDRIPGGSSGGEGAIVGAGASPMGLAADIGGSIRMPAFFCGAFGHKPTGGLVPGTGQFPNAENDALRYLTTGPITRHAEDLFPFLQAIAGPDGEDAGCLPYALGDPAAVSLEGLPVLDIRDNGVVRVTAELQAAQARCSVHLGRVGARVRVARVRQLAQSLDIWGGMLNAATETPFASLLGGGPEISVGRELWRWRAGRSDFTFPALALALLERVPMFSGRRAALMKERGLALRDQLEALIGDGVMLYPSYAEVAPRHQQPVRTPWRWVYTAIINVLELPATQVPLGLNDAGLPLGVQVVGRRGNDHITIAVASELERAFGGWRAPLT